MKKAAPRTSASRRRSRHASSSLTRAAARMVPLLMLAGAGGAFAQQILGTGDVSPDPEASPWDAGTYLLVGSTADGTLHISNGGTVKNATGYIGHGSTATGAVTVEGAGSTWANSYYLHIGYDGTGTLDITNGGKVTSYEGYIGCDANATGTVLIDATNGPSTWINAGDLYIGYEGNGELILKNGGKATYSQVYIGYATGSSGTVTVDGIASTWTAAADLVLGAAGSGTLNVLNGAKATNTNGVLGVAAAGTATVDGPNSTWQNNGNLTIGHAAEGVLTITNGGRVTNYDAYIGYASGSTGTVTVDGEGSTWHTTNFLFIGNGLGGNTELHITNGGHVSNINTAFIDNATVTVNGPGSTWTNYINILIGTGLSGTGELHITNGGTVTNNGNAYIGNYEATGKVTVDGAGESGGEGATWISKGWITIADASELIIKNGGYVSSTGADIAGWEQACTVTIDGQGSTWASSYGIHVHSKGILTITNGGKILSDLYSSISGGSITVDGENSLWENSGYLIVGRWAHSELAIANGGLVTNENYCHIGVSATGIVTVDGGDAGSGAGSGGTTWNNNGDLYIGYAEHSEWAEHDTIGILNITNGGKVTSTNAYIAYHGEDGCDAKGTVTVNGTGSTWTNSYALYIGYDGSGTLHITNGGLVTSYNSYIGGEPDATGSVTVDGAGEGATWNNADGNICVGLAGSGELHITNGGYASSLNGLLGFDLDATGIATVDGEGSIWDSFGDLYIGTSGIGTLHIINGGKVNNATSYIGHNCDAEGTITIDGTGSTWTHRYAIVAGYNGAGSLTITNGGRVTSDEGYIGFYAGSSGSVLIDGLGSEWNNTGNLHIAHSGSGSLTIRNAALVTAADVTCLALDPNATGILNIGSADDEEPVAPGTLNTPAIVFGSGSGRIVFNHTDVSGEYEFSPIITNLQSGSSDPALRGGEHEEEFHFAGSGGPLHSIDHYAGITVLTGTGSNYTAPTNIHTGTLAAGNPNVLSPNSHYTIHPAGTLDLRGNSQNTGPITNAGTIITGGLEPRDGNPGPSPAATLTITGNYIGDGGTIVMNTQLGGSNSPSDKIIIDDGHASGNTFIQIQNTNGLGANTKGNGIPIILTTNNATTEPDAFTLANQVKAGAFEYTLHRGGVAAGGGDADSDDWYLRSDGGTREEVPVDVAVSTLAPRIGRSMVGTFFSRAGSASNPDMGRDSAEQPLDTESEHANLFWARAFGETGKGGDRGSEGNGGGSGGNFGFGKNGPEYSFSYYGSQIGCDLHRAESDTLGIYLGFSTLQSKIKDADGSHAGKVTMDVLSLGTYWTRYSPTGCYTDIVLQADYYLDIHSKSDAGEELGTRGLTLTASAELGYVINLTENKENGNTLTLTPQIQLVYQHTNIQNGNDSFAKIHYSATNQLYTRLGGRLAQTLTSTGLTAWLETNLWHQFDSTAKTTFTALDGSNPTTISTKLGATWTQLVLGLSAPITKNITLFATTDYNLGLDQSTHSIGGQLGIKIAW